MIAFDPSPILILAGGGEVGIVVGLGIALVLTLIYVGSTAKKKGERRRRVELAFTSAVAGPAVGALIAWVEVARGGVVGRVNVSEVYEKAIGMGIVVGVLVGLAFLITAALAPGDAGKPPADPEL
jgi:hypothetical protein